MNNNFYKTLNAELEKKTNQQQMVQDPRLDEGKPEPKQIWLFVEKRLMSFVIEKSSKSNSQVFLFKRPKAGLNYRSGSRLSVRIWVDTTIVSDNYQAGVLIAQDMMEARLPSVIFSF